MTLSLILVTVLSTASAAMPARPPEVRRETRFDFTVDPTLQDRGGVQYFCNIVRRDAEPLKQDPFARLAKLLPPSGTGWDGLDAMASRFAFTLEKDARFFNSARANDLAYIQAMLPSAKVERLGDLRFRTHLLPANSFRVRFLGPAELASGEQSEPLKAFLAFAPSLGMPESIAAQENYDFDRVMGVRTGAISVTWTAYYRLAEGRTRIVTYALTLLHNLPPFFLGGEQRVHDTLVAETVKLIEAMRLYEVAEPPRAEPAPVPPPVLPVSPADAGAPAGDGGTSVSPAPSGVPKPGLDGGASGSSAPSGVPKPVLDGGTYGSSAPSSLPKTTSAADSNSRPPASKPPQ